MAIWNLFGSRKPQQQTEVVNKLNQILFPTGFIDVKNDYTATWAVETAYKNNPDVYSIVQQMAMKTASIPYFVKKVKDKELYKKYQSYRGYQHKNTTHLLIENKAKQKAFEDDYLKMPLEKPNPLMGWSEFLQLYKTYLKLTGNAFIYILRNERNEPLAAYILPAHKMRIIVRQDAFDLTLESPIAGYYLEHQAYQTPFTEEEVIHIKLPNPEWQNNAEQLLGLSPLRSGYINIENQIEANKHIQRLFKSAGAIGVAYAEDGSNWGDTQAKQFTEAIKEMDSSGERMARIKAVSGKVGFAKMSLGNDEMNTWAALGWDRKTICNLLGWQDELLNNDGTSSLSSNEVEYARRIVIGDNIVPDLQLLEEAFNERFIKDFKGYENAVINWDVSELPEMQDDVKTLMEWAKDAPLTKNEVRELIKFERLENEGMDDIWVNRSLIRMDEAMLTDDFFNKFEDEQAKPTV